MAHEQSELLKLFQSRWDDGIKDMPDKYKRPDVNHGRLEQAVVCQAAVDNSNPWAGPRMRLHLEHGYELPSEVLKECNSRRNILTKQHLGRIAENEALQKKKRQLDQDRAWNQFHSAEYAAKKAAA